MDRVITPKESGLLATMVLEGSPAREAGVRQGDILVAYDERALGSAEDLGAAVDASAERETVELLVLRAGKRKRVRVRSGRLGVSVHPVLKGEPLEVRPAQRAVSFDFSSLRTEPRNFWLSFWLGRRRAGFEHHVYRRRGDRLLLGYEVAFDGGKQWGLNHFVVNLILDVASHPQALSARFENPVAGWVTEGKVEAEGGARRWHSVARGRAGAEDASVRVPAELLPSYAVPTLSLFLAPTEGACFHYAPLNEGLGQPAAPAAMLYRGRERITVGRARPLAHRWESHSLGNHIGSAFVGEDGGFARIDYGTAAHARPATREEALAAVNPALEPRTA